MPPESDPQRASAEIVAVLKAADISIAASVPDAWLTSLIETLEADPAIRHVPVAREDDGGGVCAGAYLGGARGVLVCQNAGLLVAANMLAGYAHHHQIPFLILAALRGDHDDRFYYQVYKGRVTAGVADAIGLPSHVVEGPERFWIIEEAAEQAWLHRRPAIVYLRRRALHGVYQTAGVAS